ncbi:MAG: hypothetical protein WD226_11005 [Planctomycetota bacterium]
MSSFAFPTLASLSATVLLAAPLAAQRSLEPATGAGYDARERPVLVGPGYRMVFDSAGAAYHPALGAAAERVEELKFRLESVRVGHKVVCAGSSEPPTLFGRRVTYRRAGGLLERYDATTQGVEQTFVLVERPAAAGDLVVRGRLDVSMPFAGQDEGGLRFARAELGSLSLGAVTGVDAAGRTARGELCFDGEYVEYVLPAAFVETAAYPLVVDPLIESASTVSGGSGNEDFRPDAAYELSADEFLVVWDVEYGLGDFDVQARRVRADGTPLGGILPIRTVIGSVAAFPAVASVRGANAWIVTWSEGALLGGRNVWVRTVLPGGVASPSALVANGTTATRSDVGGESILDPSATEALVAWTHGTTGLWAAQVTPGTASTAPVVFDHTNLASLSSGTYTNPAISKSGGGPGRWVIAVERNPAPPTTGDADIAYVLVNWELALLGGPFSIATLGVDERRPDVDGSGTEFYLVYERENGVGNYQIHKRFFGTNGLPSSTTATGSVVPFPFSNEQRPSVAYTGDRIVIAYRRTLPTAGLSLIHYCTSSLRLCSDVPTPTSSDEAPALAARFAGAAEDTSDEGLMAWKSGGATSSIRVQPFDGTQLGAYVTQGGGCGAAVTLTPHGEWALGNAGFGFDVDVLDAGATLGVLNVRVRDSSLPGYNTGALFACGACTLMVEAGTLLTFPISGGSGSVDTPIPGLPELLFTKVALQCFVLPTTASPCAAVSNVSASERVHFTLGG